MTGRGSTILAKTSSHASNSNSPASSSTRSRTQPPVLDLSQDSNEPPLIHSAPSTTLASGLLAALSPLSSRAPSPLAPRDRSYVGHDRSPSPGNLGQFFNDTWNQGWSSVQDLTSTLLTGNENGERGGLLSPSNGLSRPQLLKSPSMDNRGRKVPEAWGPLPPDQKPGVDIAERQSALKAARTASILESHDGVNGGLDVLGRYKRRNSDEHNTSRRHQEDYLVYIHHVQPEDTYAGLILRYKCGEDAFRKANGLWSRDSLQTRKWLTIPVDACDLRGRPCDPPPSQPTHQVTSSSNKENCNSAETGTHDDFYSRSSKAPDGEEGQLDDNKPWTHVRWVEIDSLPAPVEIGRVAWGAMGYFPPRRRKSLRTTSSFSTPRQSIEVSQTGPASVDGMSPRRLSSLSNRPQMPGTPLFNRNRPGSDSPDTRPLWMRRPGGVGTMGKNVKSPGPDSDYINTWAQKNIPGLSIDGPSMSIMASETAHFGFSKESGELVESPFEEGRDAASVSRQGTGLDRAAAAVETWLRGALAKAPGTPLIMARSRSGSNQLGVDGTGDLIELTDATSDDVPAPSGSVANMMSGFSIGSPGPNDGGMGSLRGRSTAETRRDRKSD